MVEDHIPFEKNVGVNLPGDYKRGESNLLISRRKIG
jgi:hypothetical protein